MKHPFATRLVTGLMILLMGLFPLAETAATAPSSPPAVESASGRVPATVPAPMQFYFGDSAAQAGETPAGSRVGDWSVPAPATFQIMAQEGGQAPQSTATIPPKPAKTKSEPHVSWFETREGKITSGIIIAGIIVGAVVYAACQGNVVVVSDGGIRVQTKRK